MTEEEKENISTIEQDLKEAREYAEQKAKEAEVTSINHADTEYSETKEKVENGEIYIVDKYGQVVVNEEGLNLEEVAGSGIIEGGTISIENYVPADNEILATMTQDGSYTIAYLMIPQICQKAVDIISITSLENLIMIIIQYLGLGRQQQL
ncbi:hypothetical protein [Chengkuizengella axinellae]|uniref:Uncharacterized protein n=1 Tax=Chengkuizengella axinellae TaxID=3064388 RepID=A0ABT9IYL7_9BACL|nr:hypothetical protein [Chengkuizengella sp. 2205SS18-9]MDP5274456.1 hypothetical protein [Chengkuizengella sp. 2205SS18-9]